VSKRSEASDPLDWDNLGFHFRKTDTIYRAFGRLGGDPVWDAGEFLPFGPVAVSPAAAFFSYGLGIFEGQKAHRTADGRILLFRIRDNARRFQESARRLLMAPFPEESFVAVAETIVRENSRFVPPYGKGSLYLRPVQHAVESKLGIGPASEYWVLMFGVPVGSYFRAVDGARLKVLEQGRVAPGGTGSAKAIGNYAGGIAVSQPWKERGFDDVLYLDARHVRFVTETSGSNVFVKLRSGGTVTPPLDDQILAGITRDSAIRLLREVLGETIDERPLPIEEVLDDGEEIFCTGTAWTVLHVKELDYRGKVFPFPATRVQQALLDEIRGIQRGERDDRFGWVTEVRA